MLKIEPSNWEPFCDEFENKVFSLTRFSHRRRQILTRITEGTVLNLGCGCTNHLNRALISQNNTVIATDFCKKMLRKAKEDYKHEKLKHAITDSRNLKFKDETFNSVISVNSLLPEKRSDVKKILKEVHRVLKPKGVFVAFLTAFDSVQKAVTNLGLQLQLDHEQKRVQDTTGWQCFHDHTTIGKEMRQAGFENYIYEKVFLDSEEEKNELRRLYNVNTEESLIYEYLLVAKK